MTKDEQPVVVLAFVNRLSSARLIDFLAAKFCQICGVSVNKCDIVGVSCLCSFNCALIMANMPILRNFAEHK